jgi:ribulose 1,5-bisphosphate synthetase/thiazole synthase
MIALRPWPVAVNEIAYIQDSKTNVMSDTKWDHVTDIVVVGSRAARYCAAVTARSEGAEVLMIEKGTGERGASKCSGGEFWAPNNRFQKERGITDAKEERTPRKTPSSTWPGARTPQL